MLMCLIHGHLKYSEMLKIALKNALTGVRFSVLGVINLTLPLQFFRFFFFEFSMYIASEEATGHLSLCNYQLKKNNTLTCLHLLCYLINGCHTRRL
jgi:hypothetical protein